MTAPPPYTVVVEAGYLEVYRHLRHTDAQAAARVRRAIRALESDPTPAGSFPLGSGRYRRMHLGTWRILYEIDRDTIRVWTLGRIPGPE